MYKIVESYVRFCRVNFKGINKDIFGQKCILMRQDIQTKNKIVEFNLKKKKKNYWNNSFSFQRTERKTDKTFGWNIYFSSIIPFNFLTTPYRLTKKKKNSNITHCHKKKKKKR